MAKTATKRPAAKPNLFARAASNAKDVPKKKAKGTVVELPKDLNDAGELIGESKLLNESVTQAIKAKREMDAAKGLLSAAVGLLKPYAEDSWADKYAVDGVQPETPVTIQNHRGETLTYVVQDKCGQNPISAEQAGLLGILVGREVAAELVTTIECFGFDPTVMAQAAGGSKAKKDETVQDVIFKIVSDAVIGHPSLSDEQKAGLIVSTSKRYLRKGTISRIAELCGSNTGKVKAFVQAAGSAFVRYLKV